VRTGLALKIESFTQEKQIKKWLCSVLVFAIFFSGYGGVFNKKYLITNTPQEKSVSVSKGRKL